MQLNTDHPVQLLQSYDLRSYLKQRNPKTKTITISGIKKLTKDIKLYLQNRYKYKLEQFNDN